MNRRGLKPRSLAETMVVSFAGRLYTTKKAVFATALIVETELTKTRTPNSERI